MSTRWSKRQLLRKVGWLSVRQLVFFHTVLQAHKTLITGVPKLLHHDLTLTYPRVTRCATGGQLRQGSGFVSKGTFKYRAIQNFNMVPADVKTGSTATVKTKLKKMGHRQYSIGIALDELPVFCFLPSSKQSTSFDKSYDL